MKFILNRIIGMRPVWPWPWAFKVTCHTCFIIVLTELAVLDVGDVGDVGHVGHVGHVGVNRIEPLRYAAPFTICKSFSILNYYGKCGNRKCGNRKYLWTRQRRRLSESGRERAAQSTACRKRRQRRSVGADHALCRRGLRPEAPAWPWPWPWPPSSAFIAN